jgi:hypothetical protein
MDFVSEEETLYWQRRNYEFICESLKKLCGKKFSAHPIIIKKQECFGGETGKYYVCLDYCHDITHVFDANQEIYEIPAVKVLLDERETCFRIIQETKTILTKIENETYHLGNVRHLDSIIENLFLERAEQLPRLKETIGKNEERIKKIKRELTQVFADFLSKHE